jgi:glycosyltransferase involved in cell wall biosynthesis
MKILYLITNADLSGAPIHLLQLSEELSHSNEVMVVFGVDGPIIEEFKKSGIQTEILYTMKSDFNFFNDIKSITKFCHIIDDFSPDIIHCHSSKAGLIGRISARIKKVPSIFTVHGWGFGNNQGVLKSTIIYLLELYLSRMTAYYIFVSNYDKKVADQKIKNFKGKVIYNGTDFTEFHGNGRATLDIVMVARNDPQKDYQTIIKALAESKFNTAKFVGHGTNDKKFIDEAQLILGKNFRKVNFLGERKDVNVLLEDSTLFILTTNYEGLPISIIEAMSKSLPIIATSVGGIPELVEDGENGFLIGIGDHLNLVQKINKLNDDTSLREKLGKNSFDKYVKKFRKSEMVANTKEVYQKVFLKHD